MIKETALDFEFNRPANKDMGLISVSTHNREDGTKTWWLRDKTEKQDFAKYMARLRKEGHTLVGYAIQLAEARCVATFGVDPNSFKWRDIYSEWLWLRNHDDRFNYGSMMKHVGNDFYVERVSVPPVARVGKKASQAEIEEADEKNKESLEDIAYEMGVPKEMLVNEQLGYSLLDCMYAFDVITKSEFKDAIQQKKYIRDEIIIKKSDEVIEDYRQKILDYNADDVKDLLELGNAVHKAMVEVGSEEHYEVLPGGGYRDRTFNEAQIRELQWDMADWAARLAKYAQRGIPLHQGRFNRMLEVIPQLKHEAKVKWNKEHPMQPLFRVGLSSAMLDKRKGMMKQSPYCGNPELTFSSDNLQEIISKFSEETGIEWPKTKTGAFDTGKKIIERYAAGENIVKHYERYKKAENTYKVYSPDKTGHVKAKDFVGSDGCQRPNFSPFGTQTARNGAKATSYCFLGPHWLRMLVDPPKGKAIVELDYGSQEVFVAACMGGDENMKKAYLAPDTYVYYAQQIGMYPKDLPIPTEEERSADWFKPYKKVRTVAKVLNLSMQFGAGAASLAASVKDATRDPVTGEADETIDVDQGKQWIEDYRDTYPDYSDMVEDLKREYKQGMPLMLANGWRLGRDNPSPNSIANLPIQGTAAIMLQRACKLADEAGLTAVAVLHDAITFVCDDKDTEEVARIGTECMKQASFDILGEHGMKVGAAEVIRHGEIWMHSDRAQAAWKSLKQYFEDLT